jgi:hypothetical protein
MMRFHKRMLPVQTVPGSNHRSVRRIGEGTCNHDCGTGSEQPITLVIVGEGAKVMQFSDPLFANGAYA